MGFLGTMTVPRNDTLTCDGRLGLKILYLSSSYIPSRRASSVQVMKMCHAFARQGHEVCLVSKRTPSRQETQVGDDFSFYGVARNFEIVKLDRPVYTGGGVVYAREMERVLRQKRREIELVYSRELIGAWRATRLGLPVVLEAHGVPANAPARFFWRRVIKSQSLVRFVTISEALKDELASRGLVPDLPRVCVAHDGADMRGRTANDEGSAHPAFLQTGPHVGYVGQLWRGKGIEVIVRLAERMGDCVFHVVGGNDREVGALRETKVPENLILHGFVPPSALSGYYRHFDVLLMPYQKQVYGATGMEDISRWMSPLKMFEYMATGKPIVSSNHVVLQEVLHDEENALLVPPDDVEAWAVAVRRVLDEPGLAKRLGERARRELIEHYTWDARAQKVLDGIGEKIAA